MSFTQQRAVFAGKERLKLADVKRKKKRESDTLRSILHLIIPSTQAAVLSFLGDTILAALSPVKIQKLLSLSL